MASNKKHIVKLIKEERDFLHSVLKSKKTGIQKRNRARILLRSDISELGSGWTDEQISEAFDVTVQTVERTRKKLVLEGLEHAINRKSHSRTKPRKFDGDAEAKLIATTVSKAPGGRERWTLRLLADKMVELEVVDRVSHECVRQTLKKTRSNHG